LIEALKDLAVETVDIAASDGISLHAAMTGHGPTPVLIVPGWGMSVEAFARQYAHYADSDEITFISFDPRGQGLSAKPTGDHTPTIRGHDVHCVIEHFGLDRVVLGGWSQGVHDALAYVDGYGTDRLQALVLIDGTPRASGPDNKRDWVWYRDDDTDGYRRMLTRDLIAEPERVAREFAVWMLEDATPGNVDWLAGMMLQMPPEIAAAAIEQGADADYSDTLANADSRLPSLIVVADYKQEAAQRWISANLSNATLEAMGRHLMFWDRADAFDAVLDEFLAGLPRDGRG